MRVAIEKQKHVFLLGQKKNIFNNDVKRRGEKPK